VLDDAFDHHIIPPEIRLNAYGALYVLMLTWGDRGKKSAIPAFESSRADLVDGNLAILGLVERRSEAKLKAGPVTKTHQNGWLRTIFRCAVEVPTTQLCVYIQIGDRRAP
jgi:hypothetical protein